MIRRIQQTSTDELALAFTPVKPLLRYITFHLLSGVRTKLTMQGQGELEALGLSRGGVLREMVISPPPGRGLGELCKLPVGSGAMPWPPRVLMHFWLFR